MKKKKRIDERGTLKIENVVLERFKSLKGEASASSFLMELLNLYENKDTLIKSDKEEKKLTPYGPVIKDLIKKHGRNRYTTANAFGIDVEDLEKVESGEMELTLLQLRGFANQLNIYDIALEKGLVIPLPREFWR